MIKRYRFAHTNIEISLPGEMPMPENMGLFEIPVACKECKDAEQLQSDIVQKYYYLEITDNLALMIQQFLEANPKARQIQRPNMQIFVTSDKECRIVRSPGAQAPYAVQIEESSEETRVWVQREMVPHLAIDTIFGSLLGLEKVVLREGAMILHSAYMCRAGKAVLFSAPSETGKSTQAGLWERYRGTRQINGDRSLLVREADGWYAYGWPICGSSEICYNESYPIQAIVMLYQAKENVIRSLGPAEAMKKVMSQITINMWNTEFQMKVMDLIQQLITEVPVYELGCDISEDAVKCLESVLL